MHSKKLQVLTQKFTKTVSLFCEIFNTFAEDGVAKYFCNCRNYLDLLKLFLTKGVSLIPLLCPINVRENLF